MFTGQSLKRLAGSVAILKLPDTAVDRIYADGEEASAAWGVRRIVFRHGNGRFVVENAWRNDIFESREEAPPSKGERL
jgi:hypothetical protein